MGIKPSSKYEMRFLCSAEYMAGTLQTVFLLPLTDHAEDSSLPSDPSQGFPISKAQTPS